MDTNNTSSNLLEASSPVNAGSAPINFKRVVARALRFWYIIVLSLILALAISYIINRYSDRVYPVKASIIIKENEENAGAKFLYNNELLNPYRNFFNEIYIMKSYPLLQEVMISLGFDVSMYREGDIKTTEYYDPSFPVKFTVIPGSKSPYGKSMYLRINNVSEFTLQDISGGERTGEELSNLRFNDTIDVKGFKLFVRSDTGIKDVVNKTFVIRFNDPLSLAKRYSSLLSATWASQGASVVNLEILGEVPQKEIDFLNEFIARYQYYDIEKKNKVATMAIKFLDDQLLIIGDSLSQYEDQVEDFKQRNIITNLSEETNRLYKKLLSFEDQKFQYRLVDNYYSYIVELLKAEQYDGIFTPSSVGITDNVIVELTTQLISLQNQVNLYRSYTSRGVEKLQENPRLDEKIKEIEFVKRDILKTIENSRKTQGINEDFINKQIKLVEAELAKLPGTERELIGIQRNYSLKENLYVFLLQKRTEAGLSKASTTSDIIIVNPPMAGAAISPKIMQNYLIAFVVGLIIPLAIFLLLEVVNNRIQSKEDIEKITTVPVIGGIGHNLASDPLIVVKKPRSAMAESFRSLRSNLSYFTGDKEHQIFMVTSSIPGEGKSFTTLNLASVFALAGKRTVIVGADLRKPKLFDDLGLSNDLGLSQYLSNMATYSQIVQPCSVDNLFLIAGGPMPPNPSELLIRPAMTELLSKLRSEFDFVIIDTPPVSFVSDAFVLSRMADHSLFVIRQDYTPKPALMALEEFYRAGKMSNVSILFNDLRKIGMGYGYDTGYSYGYGYGYSYGNKRKKKGFGYYEED